MDSYYLIEVANAVDPLSVHDILCAHLQHALKCHEAHKYEILYYTCLILGILLLVKFSLSFSLFCFLLQHPADEEHAHDDNVKNAYWYPHDESAQLLIRGCRYSPDTWRSNVGSVKWGGEC